MKSNLMIILSLLLLGCSTTKESVIYGGLSGAAIGASTGYALSPDKESNLFNAAIWGAVGTAIGAGVGYLLRSEDPDNKEMKQMIRKDDDSLKDKPYSDDLGYQILKPLESKKYVIPDQKNVPENLKGKIKKQVITEHVIEERVEKKEGGKTLVFPETKVYEYDFE